MRFLYHYYKQDKFMKKTLINILCAFIPVKKYRKKARIYLINHLITFSTKQYILNIKNRKYHDPNCSSVSKMSEQNKEVVTSTSKKLQQQGYSPCGICQK